MHRNCEATAFGVPLPFSSLPFSHVAALTHDKPREVTLWQSLKLIV